MHRVRGAAAGAAVVLLLAGCGDDKPDEQAAASPEPSASATHAAEGVECSDGTGDSADPQLDLFGVRLSRDGKNVRVIFDENQPPSNLPLSWVVGFVSADGKHTVTLTADRKKNGDTSHGISVDDDVTGVDDPVRLTAEGMTTTYPVKAIDALGKGTRWYATLSLDGDEIDYCPGGAELREVLDIVPLALPDRW